MRRLTGSVNDARMQRRYRAERRFQWYCIGALLLALAAIVTFFANIISEGYTAFWHHEVQVTIDYNERAERLGQFALDEDMREIATRGATRSIPRDMRNDPDLAGTTEEMWVPVKGDIDQYLKGNRDLEEELRDQVDELVADGTIQESFNARFFTAGDSKLPELAGILSAAVGSIYVLTITLLFAFPIGVMSAIYLEEFAPDNRFTQAIEVNINNLAAVPSIIFGLLGLAVFINFFGVPRSSALVGGLTLGLMTLPVIIIATRAALRAVPDPIRLGAFAVAHEGLSAMVLEYGLAPGGWGVLVFGTLLIVGFEGLIVGIQALRLQYYEFFGRFFQGRGRPFRPLAFAGGSDARTALRP